MNYWKSDKGSKDINYKDRALKSFENSVNSCISLNTFLDRKSKCSTANQNHQKEFAAFTSMKIEI